MTKPIKITAVVFSLTVLPFILAVYFNIFGLRKILFPASRVEITTTSFIDKYELQINNKELIGQTVYPNVGLFGKKSATVGPDSEKYNFNRLSVLLVDGSNPKFAGAHESYLNFDSVVNVSLIDPNIPIGEPILTMQNDQLIFTIWLHPKSISNGTYTPEELAIYLNTELIATLKLFLPENQSRTISELEKEAKSNVITLSKQNKLPIIVQAVQ